MSKPVEFRDILDELRAWAGRVVGTPLATVTLARAVAEIERLRAEVAALEARIERQGARMRAWEYDTEGMEA